MNENPKTVIGIPGCWADRTDIVTSIISKSGGYIFAGMILMKLGTKDGLDLEIHDRDSQLRRSFSIAGRGRLYEQDLNSIDSHRFILYLSSDSGSTESAMRLMDAANGLLNAGGLAVKIESTGIAHRADQWAAFSAEKHLVNLIEAYVTFVGKSAGFYSCGMHNLGYPDAIIDAAIPSNEAAMLLQTFLRYLAIETPTLLDGQTFSIDADAPRYRLFREPCTLYPADDLFHNPFGMWKLIPAERH